MVDASGHLWITDFGLAQVQTDAGITMTGDILGTLRYMSPEQASGRSRVTDHHTDIYSLGVTLYELLTLRPPFAGDDRQEILRQITSEDPAPPRHSNRAIPQDLETIVLKAMAKEPPARYATAQEMADDLKRFLADEPIRARAPTLAERAAKWARRHRPVVQAAVAMLLMAVVLLSVAVVWVMSARKETERQRDEAITQGASQGSPWTGGTAKQVLREQLYAADVKTAYECWPRHGWNGSRGSFATHSLTSAASSGSTSFPSATRTNGRSEVTRAKCAASYTTARDGTWPPRLRTAACGSGTRRRDGCGEFCRWGRRPVPCGGLFARRCHAGSDRRGREGQALRCRHAGGEAAARARNFQRTHPGLLAGRKVSGDRRHRRNGAAVQRRHRKAAANHSGPRRRYRHGRLLAGQPHAGQRRCRRANAALGRGQRQSARRGPRASKLRHLPDLLARRERALASVSADRRIILWNLAT